MRKSIFILTAFLLCLPALNGQDAETAFAASRAELSTPSNGAEKELKDRETKKGQFNMMLGTSFGYAPGYGSMMSLYAAPTYSLDMNQRWTLHGGVVAANYMGLGAYGSAAGGESAMGYPASTPQFSAFVAASYQASDRLTLHGAAQKHLLSSPYGISQRLVDDLSFGASYRIGDNMSIGATVTLRNGNPYAPFGTSSYGHPFMPASPLHSPLGW